jgi:hypothetical protein
MRLLAFLLALLAVLLLGRVLFELIQFGVLAWLSLVLGLASAAGAAALLRGSRRRTP